MAVQHQIILQRRHAALPVTDEPCKFASQVSLCWEKPLEKPCRLINSGIAKMQFDICPARPSQCRASLSM